jgi:hypothetical protein
LHVDGQIRAKHLALQAGRALLRVGDEHRVKPLLRNFLGFLEDFFGTDFETDVASLAPFLVDMNVAHLFLLTLFFFQSARLPSPFPEVFSRILSLLKRARQEFLSSSLIIPQESAEKPFLNQEAGPGLKGAWAPRQLAEAIISFHPETLEFPSPSEEGVKNWKHSPSPYPLPPRERGNIPK